MPHLDNWSVCYPTETDQNSFQHPELRAIINGFCLHGVVKGHPRIADGLPVITSSIKKLTTKTCQTNNTLYTLGKPDPGWVEFLKEHGSSVEEICGKEI